MPKGFGNELSKPGDIAPANNLAAITPDDETDLEFWTRAIYVGTGGDITLIGSADDDEVTLVAVPSGAVLPISAKRVLDTGTTAEDLVALY